MARLVFENDFLSQFWSMFEVQNTSGFRASQSEARPFTTLVSYTASQAKKLMTADARAIGSRLVSAVAAL